MLCFYSGSPTSTVEHLPPLNNLQPVAMVALDAVKESFQIENFSSKRRQERRSLPTELVSKKSQPNSVHRLVSCVSSRVCSCKQVNKSIYTCMLQSLKPCWSCL